MKYGYGRVSTLYQQKEGNGFELIVGDVAIVGDDGENFISLNDKQIETLYKMGILDNRHIEDILNFNK